MRAGRNPFLHVVESSGKGVLEDAGKSKSEITPSWWDRMQALTDFTRVMVELID